MLCTAVGALAPDSTVWFGALRDLALMICLGNIVLSAIWEVLSAYLAAPPGVRLQATKVDPPKYGKEILGSTVSRCCFDVGTLHLNWMGLQGPPFSPRPLFFHNVATHGRALLHTPVLITVDELT